MSSLNPQKILNRQANAKLFFQYSKIYTLFEELIHKPWGYQTWQPLVDILERDDQFEILVDLPGVDKDQIKVRVVESRLIIEGQRLCENELERAQLRLCERPRGIFVREIEFHSHLSDQDILTEYKDGVLMIIIKKHNSD